MKYLLDFLAVQADEKVGDPLGGVLTKLTEPPFEVENRGECPWQGTDKTDETYETEPDPLDALTVCRRTAWGSLVWSDPDEPVIELFGPPPRNLGGHS